MGGKTYVLSDLHGHYEVFKAMLNKIDFDDQDTLYILGDVCDRGPRSLEIYFEIQKHKNMILLRGNHEIMMRESLMKDNDINSNPYRLWQQNGGRQTVISYHRYLNKINIDVDEYTKRRRTFFKEMIDYIQSLPCYKEIRVNGQDYLLIHAGINPDKTLEQQNEDDCAWMREYFYTQKGLDGKIIIFGHTPTCFISGKKNVDVWFDPVYHDKIGIDGGLGSFNKGQLNCICLDTMEISVVKKEDVYEP